jgi:uncharacterized protein HemY
LSPKARVLALMAVAYAEFQNHNDTEAINRYEELVHLRRFGDDWRYLGTLYLSQNSPEKAYAALLKASEIRPFRAANRETLAKIYDRLGKPHLAEQERYKANWLQLHHQD